MPRTTWAADHALRVTKQSPKPWLYVQSKTLFGKFIGPMGKAKANASGDGIVMASDDNALVRIVMELSKGKGDNVTFPMIKPLESEGVIADGDLEGNEEQMFAYDFNMVLKSIGHAVRGDGDLTDMRVAFNPKQQATIALAIWMGRKIDEYTIMALSGLASGDTNIAAVAPANLRKWVGGQTLGGTLNKTAGNLLSELNVQTDHLFGPEVIQEVHRMATMADPVIPPIMVDGKESYVMLLHPYQVKALKQTTEWKNIQQNAGVRGTKNPIVTGALGMLDGVWLHEVPRIETRLGAGGVTASEYFDTDTDVLDPAIHGARALFCGAGAVCQAFGRTPRRVTDTFDYNRKWGVGMDCILEVKKPVFNELEYAVIAVDTTYVPD